MKTLTIILPVYNEEKTLEIIVRKLQRVNFIGISKELIIVNDGSKDNTKKLIIKLKKKYKNIKSIDHKKNQGKGAAIRTGLKHSSGDIITIQDGDLEYDPEDLKKLIRPILNHKYKVVYGSRFLKKHRPNYKIYFFGNKFLSFITRVLYSVKITDMETCYKMMTKNVIRDLNLTANSFDIEPEITSKILKKGYKILEIPISYKSRSFEEGKKISWKDGIQAIFTLFYWKLKTF